MYNLYIINVSSIFSYLSFSKFLEAKLSVKSIYMGSWNCFGALLAGCPVGGYCFCSCSSFCLSFCLISLHHLTADYLPAGWVCWGLLLWSGAWIGFVLVAPSGGNETKGCVTIPLCSCRAKIVRYDFCNLICRFLSLSTPLYIFPACVSCPSVCWSGCVSSIGTHRINCSPRFAWSHIDTYTCVSNSPNRRVRQLLLGPGSLFLYLSFCRVSCEIVDVKPLFMMMLLRKFLCLPYFEFDQLVFFSHIVYFCSYISIRNLNTIPPSILLLLEQSASLSCVNCNAG